MSYTKHNSIRVKENIEGEDQKTGTTVELRAVGGSVALSFHSAVLDNRVVAEALPLKATNISTTCTSSPS